MKEKRGKKKKHRLRKLLFTLLVIVGIFLGGWYFCLNAVYGRMNYREIESVSKESASEDGVFNLLLIGNDSRENGEDGRSDAMILLSINHKKKTIAMVSLLRDMYVEIPGHDSNRLNAAYAFGGPELLMETVEMNFGIKVNRYMLVNFEAFANLVDAVDGIELEITGPESEYINAYLVEYNLLTKRPEGTDYIDISGGIRHLNGPQALAYSRIRYIGTDFGRTQRQRKVLFAVIKKLPAALVKNPGKITEGLLPNITTNLTKAECYRLGLLGPGYLRYELLQGSVPIQGSYKESTIRGMAVLEVDFSPNKEYLQDLKNQMP